MYLFLYIYVYLISYKKPSPKLTFKYYYIVIFYNFRFYMATGFQGCIGCIDCTHVAIVPPSKDPLNTNPEYIYVNRKGYHSINVQLV